MTTETQLLSELQEHDEGTTQYIYCENIHIDEPHPFCKLTLNELLKEYNEEKELYFNCENILDALVGFVYKNHPELIVKERDIDNETAEEYQKYEEVRAQKELLFEEKWEKLFPCREEFYWERDYIYIIMDGIEIYEREIRRREQMITAQATDRETQTDTIQEDGYDYESIDEFDYNDPRKKNQPPFTDLTYEQLLTEYKDEKKIYLNDNNVITALIDFVCEKYPEAKNDETILKKKWKELFPCIKCITYKKESIEIIKNRINEYKKEICSKKQKAGETSTTES